MSSAIHDRLTPKSIRTQLTLWYLAMLAASLAAFAAFVFVVRARTLYREADADLEIHAHAVLGEVEPALLGLDVSSALADDRRLDDEPIVVREPSGAIVFRDEAFPPLGAEAEAAAVRAARGGGGLVTVEDLDGRPMRLATVVATRPGAEPLVLQMAASTDPIVHALQQLAVAMAMWFAFVLAIASWGGSFIARRALRPVDAIVARVRAIQANRLGERLDLHTGSEELDRLIETLNNMLDRVEESMHGAQRFAADASHELQTPIAAMRAALEVWLGDGRRPFESRAMAVDLLGDIERLSALVRDLRLLALADAGHLVDHVEAVDLSAVVEECCDIVSAIAEPRQIAVTCDIQTRATVRGSALHLRRAILNLAQNAVRYSRDGTRVHVSIACLGDEVAVAVIDEGCGISTADLPHIFERFYRADPARARDTGGTGLGLAIADQIVRTHGGRIEVASEVDQGSTFLVRLPLHGAAAPVSTAWSPAAVTINAV